MRLYQYWYCYDSIEKELVVSTSLDKITGLSSDYHGLKAPNIQQATRLAKDKLQKLSLYYLMGGEPE